MACTAARLLLRRRPALTGGPSLLYRYMRKDIPIMRMYSKLVAKPVPKTLDKHTQVWYNVVRIEGHADTGRDESYC